MGDACDANVPAFPPTRSDSNMIYSSRSGVVEYATTTLKFVIPDTSIGPAHAAGRSLTPRNRGVWGSTTSTALDRLAMVGVPAEVNSLLTNASRIRPGARRK